MIGFKKLTLVTSVLMTPWYIYAVDYTSQINGSKTFDNGDTITVSDTNAAIYDVTSSGAAGIHVNNGAIDIHATNTTFGVRLVNHVANDLGNGSSITVDGNRTSYGVDIRSNDSSLTAQNLNVAVSNSIGPSRGINIESGASITLTGRSTITARGSSGGGYGILIFGSTNNISSFNAEQVTIETNGPNTYGIQLQNNSHVNLGDGSIIKVNGSGTYGIMNYGGNLTAKNLTIIQDSAGGSRGKGIDVRGVVDIDGGSITATDGNGISVSSGGSLNYKNATISTSGSSSYALLVQANTSAAPIANLDNVVFSINNSTASYGIWALGLGGLVNANDITMDTKGTLYGLVASNQGIISLTGNTIINTESSGIATLVDGNGSQIVTGSSGSKMVINGSLYAQNQGVMNLNMQQGSYLNGIVSTDDTATTDLTMTGTTWDMINDSNVTNLTATNSAINFLSEAGSYKKLEVNSFTGNNTNVAMNVDLGGITSATNEDEKRIGIAGVDGDLLTVTNAMGSGHNTLTITNNGSANTQGNEVLQVVVTPDNNTGNFTLTKSVEAGAYEYELRESSDDSANKTGWELYSPDKKQTTTADAVTSFLNIGYLTNYIENQTLLQRLGDLRNSGIAGVEADGLWIKGFGGKLSSFSGHTMKGFDMSYTGAQLGIDKNIDIQDGRLLVGVVTGFTHTNPSYRQGDGSGKNYTAGIYATYLNNNGIYVDNIIKYNSMHNRFNVKDTAGDSVKGTGKTQGITLSSEIGKRFWLSDNLQGFYVEPQAQLSYSYQNGDTVHASNGLNVSLSHYNSTLGRIGGLVGYQILGENPINVYVKTGVIREMSGGASYRFNYGDKKSYSFRSNWFDNAVGANITVNKKHSIYAEADYSTGNLFDNTMLNVGYRYSF